MVHAEIIIQVIHGAMDMIVQFLRGIFILYTRPRPRSRAHRSRQAMPSHHREHHQKVARQPQTAAALS